MNESDALVSVEQRLSQQLHGLIDLTAELTKRLLAACVDQPEADLPVMEELPDQEHTAFLEEEQHHPDEEALLEDDDDSQMPLLSA
ncbi:MAG: hypothetical protein VW938_02960 [Synechococcus sp.]